jgi:NTP pyrophosphatase (non-canonical NTP hydrolase)
MIKTSRLDQAVKKIIEFNRPRNWLNLAPVDCAKSIVIEGAELLEHFQWDETTRFRKEEEKLKNWEEIQLEVADVFWYLISFCEGSGIDLATCVEKKLPLNAKKFPVEKFTKQNNRKFYKETKKASRQLK